MQYIAKKVTAMMKTKTALTLMVNDKFKQAFNNPSVKMPIVLDQTRRYPH